MNIPITTLEQLIVNTLRKKYDVEDVTHLKEIILFGELSEKKSHGIVRLLIGKSSVMAQQPTGKPTLHRRTKVSSIIEGNMNPGMLVGSMATQEVIRIAKEHDFGIVGTKQSNSTSGCLTYYLEQIATQDLIGVIMTQSPKSTVAYGGIEPLFGTNPIGFGIPATPEPLVFDMATSAISFGALLKAQALHEQIPENVAIDKEGNPTTDPTRAMEGATLAFDKSYKGSGLAMMVEILSGVWPGADFVGKNPDGAWGNTFIAFSPGLLSDINLFKERMVTLIETVRNSKTKSGQQVRIPGEHTIQERNKNIKNGTVDIDENLLDELKKQAA